jgi:hypothetical protein
MIRRALVLAGVLLTALLLSAGPAWAHGGPIQLDVRSDGGQGVTATVTYVRDGHAVPDEVRMTYTAVSTDGKTIGPVQMRASAEGQAFYQGRDPLPVGDWTVTMTATKPSSATRTVSIQAVELPPVTTPTVPAPSSTSTVTLVAIPVSVAAIGLAVAFYLRRRKHPRPT